MPLMYSIVSNGEGESVVTVFVPGGAQLVAQSDHPNFAAIVAQCVEGEAEGLADLFDASVAASRYFDRLSERVTVANGHVYLDGDVVDTSLTKQVLRFLDAGVEDWQPLVSFFEKVQANPSDHSREQLYDWLNAHDFTLTAEGDIVGYKGVRRDGERLVSGWTGTAIVDGEVVNGHIPNEVGSIIEMPRQSVAFDPGQACSTGLHVGTYDYARGYAQGAMLKVLVNPRDVVSVPTDAGGEKVRVCRYVVQEVIDAPVNGPIDFEEDFPEDDEDGWYDDREDEADLGW